MDDITETPTENVDATKTARARRTKKREEGPDVFDDAIAARAAQDQTLHDAMAEQQTAVSGQTVKPDGEIVETQQNKWVSLFPHRRDNEAGVRIEEDRQDKIISLISRDRLPKDAVEILRERGWRREDEGVYSKKIDQFRRNQSREEAEETWLDVTNAVRRDKNLPEIESFFLSRA